MKHLYSLLLCVVAISLQSSHAQQLSAVVGTSPFQDSLWVIDTTNFAVTHRVGPTLTGFTVTGLNGLAKHPVSGTVYCIAKVSGVTGRVLGKIDVLSGQITEVGNLGDNFSSITFAGDSLFGVTGDGASTPETLFLIDTVTAVPTSFRTLGNGADGEVICYNPDDAMMYHWSGNGTLVYEKFSAVDPLGPITNIPLIGASNGETFGAIYFGNNTFLLSNINSSFNYLGTDGTISTNFASLPDDMRGLVDYNCNRVISGNPQYCLGDSTQLTASEAFSYTWLKDSAPLSASDTLQSYYASSNGSYSCVVSDMCGTDTIAVSINVTQASQPNVALSGLPSFCTGDSTLLTGSSGGSSQWYFNGTPINGATTNSTYVTQSGLYNMTKTNASGCTDSAAVGITVVENPLPTVSFSIVETEVCVNWSLISLSGTPSGGTFSGTGVVANTFDPATATIGNNTITYSFTDGNGCSGNATDLVIVNECLGINESAENLDFTVYPNPANDIIHVQLNTVQTTLVRLVSMSGQLVVEQQNNDTNDIELNCSNIDAGTYILTILSNDRVYQKHIVIQ